MNLRHCLMRKYSEKLKHPPAFRGNGRRRQSTTWYSLHWTQPYCTILTTILRPINPSVNLAKMFLCFPEIST